MTREKSDRRYVGYEAPQIHQVVTVVLFCKRFFDSVLDKNQTQNSFIDFGKELHGKQTHRYRSHSSLGRNTLKHLTQSLYLLILSSAYLDHCFKTFSGFSRSFDPSIDYRCK
jgi:hypothetical protein